MVIGDNHEAQLAPYHEFECTGYDDEYVQDVDITQEVLDEIKRFAKECKKEPLREALEWYGLEDRVVENPSQLDILSTHKYGYAIVCDEKLIKAIKRTNPNAKWDWWQVGGRWTGFLKLKPGSKGEVGKPGLMTPRANQGWADSALKGDVDWEGMRNHAGEKAAQDWDSVRSVASEDWESWESVRKRFSDISEARTFYQGQYQVKAAKKLGFWSLDDFLTSRENYIEKARSAAVATFAMLYKYEWIERGEMGWWGIIGNDSGKEVWVDKAWEIIQSVPDDELITIVDCHI